MWECVSVDAGALSVSCSIKLELRFRYPSVSTPGQHSHIATVFGPPDGCNCVKQMIKRIVLEQSSWSVRSGQQQQHGDSIGQYEQQNQRSTNSIYGQEQQYHQQPAYGYQQQQSQHNVYSNN